MRILWNHAPDNSSENLALFFDYLTHLGHEVSFVSQSSVDALSKYAHAALPHRFYRQKNKALVKKISESFTEDYYRYVEEARLSCLTLRPHHFIRRIIDWQLSLFIKLRPDVLLSWGGVNSGPIYGPLVMIAKFKGVKVFSIENSFLYSGINLVQGDNLFRPSLYAPLPSSQINGKLDKLSLAHYTGIAKDRVRHRRVKEKDVGTERFVRNVRSNGHRLIVVYGPPDIWLHQKNTGYLRNIIPFYESYRDFLFDLVGVDDCALLYKPHPSFWSPTFYYNLFCIRKSEKFHVTKVNPLVLLAYGDKFIAHYSKMESNVVLNDKLLVLPGGGFYGASNFVSVAKDRTELHSHIRSGGSSLNDEEKKTRDNFIEYNFENTILFFDFQRIQLDIAIRRFLGAIGTV